MSSISAGTTTTTGYVVSSDTTGALVLKTGASGTTALTIDTSQNVGIGTASPARKLVVSNAGAQGFEFGAGVGPSSGNEILNYNRSTSLYVPLALYASTHTLYAGAAGDALAIAINSSGNVGVGTASPTSKLTVQGTATAASTATVLTLFNSSDGGVGMNFTNAVAAPLASINALVTGTGSGTDDGILQFSTATNGTNAERARIDSSGNLLVGTTSAGGKFHVKGTSAANMTCRLEPYDNNYASKLLVSSQSSGDGGIQYGAAGGNDLDIFAYAAIKLFTGTGAISGGIGTERARIDQSGNFTLGFAASPYNNAKMEIYRTSAGDALMLSSVAGSGSSQALAWSNSRGDVVSARIYNIDDGFYGAAIAFANRTGPGTTTTERARITSGGNFLQMTGRRSNAHTLGNQQMWVGSIGSLANGASVSLFAINQIYDNLCYELDIFVNRGGYFAAKYAGVFGYNGFTTTLSSGDTGSAVLTRTGTLYNETMTLTNSIGGTVNAYTICLRVWGLNVSSNVSTGGDNLVTSAYLTRIE